VRRAWAALAVAGFVIALGGCSDATDSSEDGPLPQAPEFELLTLDGAPVSLGAMQGKIVILDFWATWCGPCKVQMPVLDSMWRERKGDDLMILGVSVDTDPVAKVAEWVDERGFEYPIAIADQDLAMRYGVFGFPTLVIIDQSGGIHTRHMGVLSGPELQAVIDEIRDGQPAQS
jgi:thiol-disulfide isomerase/thioredoxin